MEGTTVMLKEYEVKCKIHKLIPIDCGNLVVRKYKLKDTALFYQYTKDKKLTTYLLVDPHKDYQTAQVFVLGIINRYSVEKTPRFVIATKDTDELVGCISFYPSKDGREVELGYWIGRKHWNKGYMTKVLKVVIEELKTIKCIDTVFIKVDENNIASIKAAYKAGITEVKSIEEHSKGRILIRIECNLKGRERCICINE